MTKDQGQRIVRRLLGAKARIRENRAFTTTAAREAALALMPNRRAHKDQLAEALDARRRVLLAGDEEYQQILADLKVARQHFEHDNEIAHTRKMEVGYVSDIGPFAAFHIVASGDNWQELTDKLTAEAEAGRLPRLSRGASKRKAKAS